MRKFAVTAQAFDRDTGEVVGPSRTEIIDCDANALFRKCRSVMDVKECYESFWNNMNPHSQDVVFVQFIQGRTR